MQRFPLFLGTVIVALAFSTGAQAGEYDHLGSLALRLQGQVSNLYYEFSARYHHSAQGRHLLADASAMYGKARHVRELVFHRGNTDHLRSDLLQLDRLFHRIERIVEEVEHGAAHGNGHVRSSADQVLRPLRSIEETLHHMKSDYRRRSASVSKARA